MKYLLMIYENEKALAGLSQEEQGKIFEEYFAFSKSVTDSKNLLAGEALHPVSTATTVRVRDGKRTTTDGPFAETREQLGGFYLVDAKNIDEAIAIASRIPGAKTGSIEVRACVDFSQGQG